MLTLVNSLAPTATGNALHFSPASQTALRSSDAIALSTNVPEPQAALPAQALILPIAPYRAPQTAPAATPSCAPHVQHELLKAIRAYLPQTYTRINEELGFSLANTQTLLAHRAPVISAARALKLGRLIAQDPDHRQVFSTAGAELGKTLQTELSRPLGTAIRALPRRWRANAALAIAQRIAYRFAGSTNQIFLTPHQHGVYLTLRAAVFSDQLATIGAAHLYYQNLFAPLLREYAHLDCEILPIRHTCIHLNECNYKIVWDA